MHIKVNGNSLSLVIGDISQQRTEAIVNSANKTLRAGGGVCGAIHRQAGAQLEKECLRKKEELLHNEDLQVGNTLITRAYNLASQYVFHTVGPIWMAHDGEEEQLLEKSYYNTLKKASEFSIRSISFPSISTGIYRFPIDVAAEVAMKTIYEFLQNHSGIDVEMVLFSESDYEFYEYELNKIYELDKVH